MREGQEGRRRGQEMRSTRKGIKNSEYRRDSKIDHFGTVYKVGTLWLFLMFKVWVSGSMSLECTEENQCHPTYFLPPVYRIYFWRLFTSANETINEALCVVRLFGEGSSEFSSNCNTDIVSCLRRITRCLFVRVRTHLVCLLCGIRIQLKRVRYISELTSHVNCSSR